MIRSILVDDEMNALDALRILLKENCPNIDIVAEVCNVSDGIKEISNKKPDLVFLDIDMPDATGFDLLSRLPEKNFHVIFVTAFNNHAIRAFKVNAVDYLLKPVNKFELIDAVAKVQRTIQMQEGYVNFDSFIQHLKQTEIGKIAIHTSDGIEYFDPDDIIHADADGSYSKIFTKNKTIMVAKYLKEIKEILIDKRFYRAHNSFIINLNHVQKYSSKENMVIMTDGNRIMLSKMNKIEFLERMSGLN